MPNFSAKWGLMEQLQAVAAGTWTGLPAYALYAWGPNTAGQLALGDVINRSSPVQVGSQTDWESISGTMSIKTNKSLWAWFSDVGDGTTNFRSNPVQVGTSTDWTVINGLGGPRIALKTNGTLWVWGDNSSGQLGQNNRISQSSPVQVGALTNWLFASGGGTSRCMAVKTDGTLWAWGYNGRGQLGLNDTVNRSSPVQVGALTDWLTTSCGLFHTLAIKSNGTLWAWGKNTNGELGDNTTVDRLSPVQVGALTSWSRISAANYHNVASRTNGTLWTWGENNSGCLGLGTNNPDRKSSPTQVGALTDWSRLAASQNTTLAIRTNGTLWSWGYNANGSLGNNTTIPRSSPIQIGSSTNWGDVTSVGGSCFATTQGVTN